MFCSLVFIYVVCTDKFLYLAELCQIKASWAEILFIVMWQRPFTVFTYFCVVVKKTFRIIHRCLLKLVLFIIS